MDKETDFFKKINEFEQIRLRKDSIFSVEIAQSNPKLNRYSDILPFDKNRVVLDDTGGYINASYLTSLYGSERYIAAQGPLPHTIPHFWQMIWNEGSRLVVMLTPLVEGNKVKCEQYWPEEGQSLNLPLKLSDTARVSVCADHGSVKTLSPNLTKRTFTLRGFREDDSRTIEMLHFKGWPDHSESALTEVLDLIALVNSVQSDFKANASSSKAVGPIVVHCSAGVGRTGTFCAIDGILKDSAAGLQPGPYYTAKSPCFEGEVKQFNDLVSRTVNHLRHLRVCSVQSLSQFKMIYQALKIAL